MVYKTMERWHLRLRQSDRKLLESHVEKFETTKSKILVAGYESWDVKTKRPTPLHVHVYLESSESDSGIRKRIKRLGYRTGVNYFLKKYDSSDDNFRYMCKGHSRGVYDVAYIEEEQAAKFHEEYWTTRDEIERRKEGKVDRTPVYFQIADHIQQHKHDYSRLVYQLGDRIVDQVSAEEEADAEPLYILDVDKTVDYILEKYSENGPLFDHETIKKVMWMISARLDRESTSKKARKLIGEFHIEI